MTGPGRGLCALFHEPEVVEFVDSTSRLDRLTLFVGAGVSMESGFPSWYQLVSKLLARVAQESGLADRPANEFAAWTIEREGLTAAAAVAKASLNDFPGALREVLYLVSETPRPGETGRAIAALTRSVTETRVLTTNYDLILESALERSCSGPLGDPARSIVHLHGVVGPRGGTYGQEIVLSEQDYFSMAADTSPQQMVAANELSGSACVFLGASLTDPNLLRYLYRTQHSRKHWVVFSRQQDAAIYDSSDPAVVALREETSRRRWEVARVRPIYADFFSQTAQLLHELRMRRDRGDAYVPLPERLAAWRVALQQGVLTTEADSFAQNQDAFQAVLQYLIDGIERDLEEHGAATADGERLQLSMWVYDPAAETLVNWASSDRSWRDPSTLTPLPVDWQSDFLSVQAFCAGSLVERSTDQFVATRWNHVVGAPIYLQTDPVGRLPVGAMTIASNLPRDRSALMRGLATLRRQSIPTTEDTLASLLAP